MHHCLTAPLGSLPTRSALRWVGRPTPLNVAHHTTARPAEGPWQTPPVSPILVANTSTSGLPSHLEMWGYRFRRRHRRQSKRPPTWRAVALEQLHRVVPLITSVKITRARPHDAPTSGDGPRCHPNTKVTKNHSNKATQYKKSPGFITRANTKYNIETQRPALARFALELRFQL